MPLKWNQRPSRRSSFWSRRFQTGETPNDVEVSRWRERIAVLRRGSSYGSLIHYVHIFPEGTEDLGPVKISRKVEVLRGVPTDSVDRLDVGSSRGEKR